MKRADVIDLVTVMVERWPHQAELGAEAMIDDYAHQLADVEAEHAHAALDTWYRDGQRHAPHAGQLLGRIADLVIDAPPWHQVKAAILATSRPADSESLIDCPYGECEGTGMVLDWQANTGRPCRCRPARQAARRERRAARHPLIVDFLREVGLSEVGDLATDRTAEAQVREKWKAFVDDLRRGVTYRGIASAGLPALERITAAPQRGRLSGGHPARPDFRQLVAGDAA